MNKIALTVAAAMAMGGAAQAADDFTYGADTSWMTFQEDCGVTFYTADGVESTVEDLLVDHGFNAVRLRVWVNPENYASDESSPTAGYCNLDDVMRKARRVAAKGLDIMLCFHFSDTWADPAKQRVPKAWQESVSDLDALTELAVGHVAEVCSALAGEGITPRWVQVGNEDAKGFMIHGWDGSTLSGVTTGVSSSSAAGYISAFNACAAKAREIFPEVSIVHHIANGHKATDVAWNLQKVAPLWGTVEGGTRLDADYLGLSLYPLLGSSDTGAWQSAADACIAVVSDVYTKYGLRTIIVETGMNNEYSTLTAGTSQAAHTEQCNQDVTEYTEYLVARLKATGVCDGLFYWEPQSDYTDYTSATSTQGQGYSMGAMMDVDRTTASWGDRLRLTPNAYWTTVARLAAGYEPEVPTDPEPAAWNLKYSLDDKVTWRLLPLTEMPDGTWVGSGINDDPAPYCLTYFIVNADQSESYIAGEAVERDIIYPLYTTLSGTYKGWTGWMKDKWVQETDLFVVDPAAMTLTVTTTTGAITGPEAVAPEGEPEWFTLTGVRVARPVAGGVYIRLQGGRAAKVRL